jgi:hypothetical protein
MAQQGQGQAGEQPETIQMKTSEMNNDKEVSDEAAPAVLDGSMF